MFLIFSFILLNTVVKIGGWEYFAAMKDLTLTNLPDEEKKDMSAHSEYRFGNCSEELGLVLYAHTFLEHLDVLGKLVIRGWLNINRIPTCTILRAMSWYEDHVQSTAYEFQFCVPRITYCHQHERFKYYYYEWFLPYNYVGGMDWHINFYGPESLYW